MIITRKALINIERKDKLKSYNSENFTYNHMLSKRSHSSDDDCIHNSCE